MKRLIAGALLGALVSAPALAGGHDAQLESWIKQHVAGKVGDLRGGFDARKTPELVTVETLERAKSAPGLGFRPVDPMNTGSIHRPDREGPGAIQALFDGT